MTSIASSRRPPHRGADYARELLRLPTGPAQSVATEQDIGRMIVSRLRR